MYRQITAYSDLYGEALVGRQINIANFGVLTFFLLVPLFVRMGNIHTVGCIRCGRMIRTYIPYTLSHQNLFVRNAIALL